MDATGTATRLALPSTAESGAAARRVVREVCASAHVSDEVCDTALLLVNELVVNAIEHAGGSPLLRVAVEHRVLRLEVADPSPRLPRAPEPRSGLVERGLAERGRGLFLVDALAAGWGADREPGGKTVWCELDLAR
jgi:anti-sigma regulatory factor (Ser/Thr protein kinase)